MINTASSGKKDLLAFFVITLVAFFIFRNQLFFDYLFFGNPDRLNHSLNIFKYYVDSISDGTISAWNPNQMLGFDSFSLPYTFINPLSYFATFFGKQNTYKTAAYFSIALYISAGYFSYLFIRRLRVAWFPAVIGGVLYQCSALSTLKVAQNDMSFLVLVLIPILLIIINKASENKAPRTFVEISIATFVLLEFCFIQKTMYTLILIILYSIFIAWEKKSKKIFILFIAGIAVGLIGAFPRIWGMLESILGSSRSENKFLSFTDLYNYQNIKFYELLRWFDYSALGSSFSDAVTSANNLNISEGFLLYTSAAVPFVILFSFIKMGCNQKAISKCIGKEGIFFFTLLLACFLIVLAKPFTYLIYLLFFKITFWHSRILVIALLPLVVYTAMVLNFLASKSAEEKVLKINIVGFMIGAAFALAIFYISNSFKGNIEIKYISDFFPNFSYSKFFIKYSALLNIFLSGTIVFILFKTLLSRSNAIKIKSSFCYFLYAFILVGAVIGADFRFNVSVGNHESIPFKNGDLYFSKKNEFSLPSESQLESLKQALESDSYRSIIICPNEVAGGFCASHYSNFWGLRLVDGYYGSGVPSRLSLLPWGEAIGLRQIRFISTNQIPWKLLGLLNVKYAFLSNLNWYKNTLTDNSQYDVLRNPENVTPRVFFVNRAITVGSPQEASEYFKNDIHSLNLLEKSVVEGYGRDEVFRSSNDNPNAVFSGDRIRVDFKAASFDRFLVINELYDSKWQGFIDNKSVKIYPVNVVMRGVFIPKNTTSVNLLYVPIVLNDYSMACYLISFILLLIGFWYYKNVNIWSRK